MIERNRILLGWLACLLISACSTIPVARPPSRAPSATPPQAPAGTPTMPCAVVVTTDDVGNGQVFGGTGFLPDATIEMTLTGNGQPVTLTEADFAELRTDVRGAWEVHLFADREDIGDHNVRATDGDCTAAADFAVTLDAFPTATCTPAEKRAVLGSAAATEYDAIIAADRPFAYWPLDENAATSTKSTQGGTATFSGSVVAAEPGFVEGSRSVLLADQVDPNAEGAWLDIPKLTFGGDFTIEAWIRFCGTRIGPRDALVGQATDGPEINFPEWHMTLFTGVDDAVVSSRSVSVEGWQHVALTRQQGALTLYQDGQAVGTGTYSDPLPIDAIGAGGSGTFGGWIDNVAFYDTALPLDRIAARAAFAP